MKNSVLKFSKETRALLGRAHRQWTHQGTVYGWAQWLNNSGADEKAIVHLLLRVMQGKIDNPYSVKQIAWHLQQRSNAEQYDKQAKEKAVGKDEAPEMLRSIFAKAQK
jgi:hypothetical protein